MPKASPSESMVELGVELGSTLNFMRNMWHLVHALDSHSKRTHQESGVTAPQRLVLRIASKFKEVSAGELASIMRVHPSTLTGPLRRLEERGAITRWRDPVDGRRALLSLTTQGKAINNKKSGSVENAVARALGKLTAEEIAAAEKALTRIAQELEQG